MSESDTFPDPAIVEFYSYLRSNYLPIEKFKAEAKKRYRPLQTVFDCCQFFVEEGRINIVIPNLNTLKLHTKMPLSRIINLIGQRLEGLAELARKVGFIGVTLYSATSGFKLSL